MQGLMYEFVDGVDEGFDRCCDDIGIGGESVVMYTVVSNGHMHFTHVVAFFGNGLDKEFLYRHLPVYNLLYRFDGGVDRTVSRRCASKRSPAISSPTLATERTPTPDVTCR